MREVWARIEAVLKTTAPERFEALSAGATPEAIAETENRLGFAFPADVRESYSIHNGSCMVDVLVHETFGLIDVPMLTLDEALRDRQMWLDWRDDGSFDNCKANPHGPIWADWWNRLWVPVTWDGGGDHLCIDMDPAPGGVLGQVIYFSHEAGPLEVVAASWRVYLERYAVALELGRLCFDQDGQLISKIENTTPDRM